MKTYFSQYGQDRFLHQIFFSKVRNGIFIDIGAYDGIRFSNSFYFEKYMGWRGVCVEPNPSVFERLLKNRKCILINACVHDLYGKVKFNVIDGYGEMLSGIESTYDERHKLRIENTINQFGGDFRKIEVPCITILSIIDNENIEYVDFLSIDTEGNELNILKSFPFSRLKPKVIVVENNFRDLFVYKLMKDNGYLKCMTLESDDIYCLAENFNFSIKLSVFIYKIKRSLKYRISEFFYGVKG